MRLPSPPVKSLTVSLLSFNLPTLTRPFFVPVFLDLVTIVFSFRAFSGRVYITHYGSVNAYGWLNLLNAKKQNHPPASMLTGGLNACY
jgi:hypothetical protein